MALLNFNERILTNLKANGVVRATFRQADILRAFEVRKLQKPTLVTAAPSASLGLFAAIGAVAALDHVSSEPVPCPTHTCAFMMLRLLPGMRNLSPDKFVAKMTFQKWAA